VPAAGDWRGVKLRWDGVATLAHTTISHATYGLDLGSGGSADLDGVTARLNTLGLYVSGDQRPTVDAVNSSFVDNSSYGVRLQGYAGAPDPLVTINNSSIHSNLGSYDFYATSFETPDLTIVNARDNWWGFDDAELIGPRIYDHRANQSTSPRVDWCRYQNSGGVPVVDANCPDLVVCNETQPEIWNDTEKPYQLTTDFVVCSNDSLEVGPGVEVRTVKLASNKPEFLVEGILDVGDPLAAPVLFRSDAALPAAEDWDGLDLRGDSVSTIVNAEVRDAFNGLDVRDSAHATLDGVISHWNRNGLFVYGSGQPEVTALNSSFVENQEYGVLVEGSAGAPNPVVTINQSSIHDNGSFEYHAANFENAYAAILDARENWWGTDDTVAIAAGIYDHSDYSSGPVVDWCRYQTASGGPVRDVNCPDAFYMCGEPAYSWPLADKPYLVVSDLYVCPGSELQVAEGVEARFADTGTPLQLLVEGSLFTSGAELNPVTLHSDAAVPAAGDWSGVDLDDGGSATLNHTTIAHGSYGVNVGNLASATLDGATINYNGSGLYVDGTGPPVVMAVNSTFAQKPRPRRDGHPLVVPPQRQLQLPRRRLRRCRQRDPRRHGQLLGQHRHDGDRRHDLRPSDERVRQPSRRLVPLPRLGRGPGSRCELSRPRDLWRNPAGDLGPRRQALPGDHGPHGLRGRHAAGRSRGGGADGQADDVQGKIPDRGDARRQRRPGIARGLRLRSLVAGGARLARRVAARRLGLHDRERRVQVRHQRPGRP